MEVDGMTGHRLTIHLILLHVAWYDIILTWLDRTLVVCFPTSFISRHGIPMTLNGDGGTAERFHHHDT